MRILITGGSGLLAKYLVKTQPDNHEVELTWYSNFIEGYHLDVCNMSQVGYVFSRTNPDIVIHTAAIGSVDYVENNFVQSHMVNVIGTKNVISACQAFNSKLVYISSNAVFAGDNPPYREVSDRTPVNRYGSLKREAEQAIMQSRDWMIVRPFMLYGWPYPGGRPNWLTIILDNLESKKETRLVDDVYWQPTLAEDCADAIWKLIALDKWEEMYNVAADDKMTLFQFGLKVAIAAGHDLSYLQPIASSSLKIAPRPKDTTYDLSKIEGLDIHLRNVEEGLQVLKSEQA